MKKITLLVSVLFASATVGYSQTSDAEVDAMINLLGVQKKEAVARLVHVTGKDSATFWKVYGEYQKENNKMAAERMKLYERTAMAYDNMTPQRADSLSTQYFKNRKEQENMLETYYNKIKTASNATVAFQFYQAEVYLLTLLRAQIMQQIPTYGELQLMKKKQ